MARNLKNVHIPKAFGPGGGRILTCSFSLVTTVLTALEEQGCTVARNGVGTYEITLPRVYKWANVNICTVAATTAQVFLVTSIDLANRLITIKQVTAGGGTAVDTVTARVDVAIQTRSVS